MYKPIFDSEDQARPWITERINLHATVYADDAPAWDDKLLHPSRRSALGEYRGLEGDGVSQDGAIPADVPAEVIRRASPVGAAFLVGGQALNFWAERYSAHCKELEEYGPFTSKDVDFFGTNAHSLEFGGGANLAVGELDY